MRFDGVLNQVSDPFYNDQCIDNPTDGHPDLAAAPRLLRAAERGVAAARTARPGLPSLHGAQLLARSAALLRCVAPPALSAPTVGTPEANGKPGLSQGFVLIKVSTSPQRVGVSLDLTDVREQASLADYTGELQLLFTTRITDKGNGPTSSEPGTVSDFDVTGTVPCSGTPDSSAGSECRLDTTLAALVGASGPFSGKRQIWEIERVRVNDGGPDGDAVTQGDNELFAAQGLFIP